MNERDTKKDYKNAKIASDEKMKKVSVSEREKISIDRTIDSFLVEEYAIRFHYRDATFRIIR